MKKNHNHVFIDNIRIETQTLFSDNGSIYIYPCPFVDNPHLLPSGDCVSLRGRMTTLNDGTSHFLPYAQGSGKRYLTLFRTPHGDVKETQHNIIFTLRFPKQLDKCLIENILREEQEQQLSFVKSRPSLTQWIL